MNNKMTRSLGPFRHRGPRLACLALSLSAAVAAQADGTAPAVAAQMYTLRDFGTLEERFADVERAGIGAVELVGDHGIAADEMSALLGQYGLEVVSSHVAIDALRDEIDDVIAFHRAIGNDTLVIPYLVEEARPGDAAGWRELGEEIGNLAERLAEEQARFHDGLARIESRSREIYGEGFLALDETRRGELIAALDQQARTWVADGGTPPGFTLIKQLTLLGFFTSEVGATQVLRYEAIPGRYDGCADYEPGQPAWAT